MSQQTVTPARRLPSVAALNLHFDADRLAAEVRMLQEREQWRRNRIVSQTGIGDEIMDDWKMIILRGPNGDPARTDPGGAGLASHADTPLLDLVPYHAEVLRSIPAPMFSARLMGLGPGAQLHLHRDGKWTYRFGIVRLHVPIVTNPGCVLYVEGEEFHWDAGRLWYADFDREHYARNSGSERRIHLVVDCLPTRELMELFPEDFQARLPWSEVLLARDEVPMRDFERAAFQCTFPMPATFPEWSDEPENDPHADVEARVEVRGEKLVLSVGDEPLFGLIHIGQGEFQLEGWTTERTLRIDRTSVVPYVRFRIREGNSLTETVRSVTFAQAND
nr:aspartyl/asparaginyl beta-hydroxylase domain-containing protein [uncultured Actinoplanes sp.]